MQTTAHLIRHLLREIEGSLRDALQPVEQVAPGSIQVSTPAHPRSQEQEEGGGGAD